MVKVTYLPNENISCEVPKEFIAGKRHLTKAEIEILLKNNNKNEDETWNNFYVDAGENCFDPNLIHLSFFSGFIVLGKLRRANLKYNDLELPCGIERSRIKDVVTGDDTVIRNVAYMSNYTIGNRVILFNVQELCCTNHSKFGIGIIKEGEPESHRIWIGVANENDGRKILPFEKMICADAYIWSHYRRDNELLDRFVELTEQGTSKKLDTRGFIDDDVVLKNSNIVKDTKIGKCAYIKGAQKLKNISILSSEQEPTQIGEGVEMVNGILGYGCRIFYQAIAVRFVIGRNCQIKYGARLLNSVLGDNSTVSCCEILNNLLFPFHEQHHNSSFLIATTIMGQSNIASGATIGSNHNSRSPDGEIFAKRGFWPGLCSDFKHNSKFASFTLVSKGSYQNELNITYPFSLVSQGQNGDPSIHIIPAWWFMYDMFAITRNNNKFIKRDKRVIKIQQIETDPMAPDTMQEILSALDRIIKLTAHYLKLNLPETFNGCGKNDDEKYQRAKDYLHQNPKAEFTLTDPECQKKYGAIIIKPAPAYKMYRKIVKYYATRTLIEYAESSGHESLSNELLKEIRKFPLYTEWENAGGQIIPSQKISELFSLIKTRSINNWDEVHNFYDECQAEYKKYKTRYAVYLLEQLYSRPIEIFSSDLYNDIINDANIIATDIYNAALDSRRKDYTDFYRKMTYHDEEEMENVIGRIEDNEFLHSLKESTDNFTKKTKKFFKELTNL